MTTFANHQKGELGLHGPASPPHRRTAGTDPHGSGLIDQPS